MSDQRLYDVIIVGGSYAGLSAALALGRSHLRTLIIDSGNPCNTQTPHSHNFLTQDGNAPSGISALAKSQVMRYPAIEWVSDEALSARKEHDQFVVTTKKGDTFFASKLLLATGLKDLFPPIPGLKECWGISVLHCPYCHGYEVSGQKLGVMANGEMAIHFVKLITNLSKEVVLLTNGPSSLPEEALRLLKHYKVTLIQEPITGIIHCDGQIQSVNFAGRESLPLNALFTRVPLAQQGELTKELACQLTDAGLIATDEMARTNIHGLYAAGDCCVPQRSISLAVASGTRAGTAMNMELFDEAMPVSDAVLSKP